MEELEERESRGPWEVVVNPGGNVLVGIAACAGASAQIPQEVFNRQSVKVEAPSLALADWKELKPAAILPNEPLSELLHFGVIRAPHGGQAAERLRVASLESHTIRSVSL